MRFKKILSLFLMILIILSLFSCVLASDLKTELQIVKKSSDTKYLENDQGDIVNSIEDINKSYGELTGEIVLNNRKKQVNSSEEVYENTEIFIIIPEYTDTEENEKLNYIETLCSKILDKSKKTKIGIIGIKGPIADNYIDENGNLVHNPEDEAEVKGNEKDAECIVNLTDNVNTLKTSLRKMNMDKKGYYDNLQAALRLSKNSFSEKVNKILISLYDNVPSTAIGVSSKGYEYGGWFSKYSTAEEAARAHLDDLVSATKSEILAIKNAKIKFILLRPDDTDFNQTWYNSSTGEKTCEIDGKPYADELYGTMESPTYGKMYSLNNDSLEKIVTEYIYKDVIEDIQPQISNVTINVYFPKELVENFDITILNESVDITNLNTESYITYNEDNLDGNEKITIKYKIKIKNMLNEELLNKTLNVSEKIELKYIDYLGDEKNITLSDSPKIKLAEIKQKENKKDTTTATGKIPYTGASYAIIFTIAIILIGGIIAKVKYNDLKGIK